MLDAIWLLLSVGTVSAIVWAQIRPDARLGVSKALFVAGPVAAVGAAWSEPTPLELTHAFAAYVGHEIRLKDFPIETVQAPGYAWGLVVLGFCLLWSLLLLKVPRFHAFWGPFLLALTCEATALLLEKTAAPSGMVTPLGVERFMFPISIGAAVMLARQCRRVFLTLSWLSLFVTMSRIPLAGFGTLATRGEWGTTFDVHSITLFANPFVQQPVQVEPASTAQLGWLIWSPQLLILPALYMLSVGSIAFLATMVVTHPKE